MLPHLLDKCRVLVEIGSLEIFMWHLFANSLFSYLEIGNLKIDYVLA